MKLRNKKTGKVQTCDFAVISDDFRRDGELCKLESHIFIFRSIKQLNEEYEDYEPTEPLIKDEKIRKAVQAWADMQGSCWIRKETDQCCRDSLGYFFNSSKEIFGDLELGIEYTIAELCGEDEE